MIEPPVKMMQIFMGQTDTWENQPLYEALMRRLRQLGVAGATVQKGIVGMGSHHKVHHKGLFGIPEDPPLTLTIFENEAKLRDVARELREMAPEVLMVMMDAEILTDEDAEAAAALAIDLLNDGQDQECADVLEDIQEYFAKKR